MRLIEKEEAAKRLARVILSDIELYNAQKVRSRADLKPELDEGYALFRSRVAPELVPIFSEVVADRLGGGPRKAVQKEPPPRVPAVTPPPPPPPLAPASASHAPAPAPATRSDQLLPPREAARRLARIMVAGIEDTDRDDGGIGLAREIEEARTLFRSCVVPELIPLFEDALAERGLGDDRSPPMTAAPPPAFEVPPAGNVIDPLPGDATDRVVMPETLPQEPTPATFSEDPPTNALPTVAAPPPQPSTPAPWTPSKGHLAAAAVAIATASAGIVYYLMSGP